MPRPKGSKNKAKILDGIDYAAQIAEKNTAAESLAEEIAKLEKKKADADAKVAEAAKKAEAEDVLKKLLSSGMSADEILEKLK